MANVIRGESSLPLPKGGALNLVFDFDALCQVEDALGASIADAFVGLQGTPRLRLIQALLWGATRRNHADLTADELGALILEVGLHKVTEKVTEGLVAAMPAAEGAGAGAVAEAGEGEARPQKAGTGQST